LFTSNIVKEIKTKEKVPYLVISVIIIIILGVFLKISKRKKEKIAKKKKDFKIK